MKWAAAAVHVFTGLGAVCALFATLAVMAHAPEAVFIWLGIALIIDGVDGIFARWAKVSERLPRFSGERLDLIVDYLTYVFVPVLALLSWHYLDGMSGRVLAGLILLSSLYHFADTESKTAGNWFVGFPAIWNIVAFYVFAFGLSSTVTSVLVMAAVLATFVPMPWVHPWRVTALRTPTVLASAAFAICAAMTLVHGFPAEPLPGTVLLTVAAYGIWLSLYSCSRQRRG